MKQTGRFLIGVLSSCMIITIVSIYAYHRFSFEFSNKVAVSTSQSHPGTGIKYMKDSLLQKGVPQKPDYQGRVVIVTFHDISPTIYSSYVITPSRFSADLSAISSHFHVITNQQFVDFLNHRESIPTNAVLLTFDDGYRDMYTYALPILLQHHMQGTFFEIVGTADHSDPTKLTWDEIKMMVQDGMAFESHTYNSHYEVRGRNGVMVPVFDTRLTINGKLETPKHYDNRILNDFLKSRNELSREIGEPVVQFAWPYGWGTPQATYIAERAGYQDIFTTKNGFVSLKTNRLFIPRIDIGKSNIDPVQAVRLIARSAHTKGSTQQYHAPVKHFLT